MQENALIRVARVGSLYGQCSVNWRTEDGSAQQGQKPLDRELVKMPRSHLSVFGLTATEGIMGAVVLSSSVLASLSEALRRGICCIVLGATTAVCVSG